MYKINNLNNHSPKIIYCGANNLNSPARRVVFCGRSKRGDKVEDLLAAAALLRAGGIEVIWKKKSPTMRRQV